MATKIKILKDTPFHHKDDLLNFLVFRHYYAFFKEHTDEQLIDDIKECPAFEDWFEVIDDTPTFKLNDWVWHEKLQKAFFVTKYNAGKDFWPNMVSIEAANSNTDTYKRLASKEEITGNILYIVKDDILIGRNVCYYFFHTWHQIFNVHCMIQRYLKERHLGDVHNDRKDAKYEVYYNGLTIGCKTFSPLEIQNIAKLIGLIP